MGETPKNHGQGRAAPQAVLDAELSTDSFTMVAEGNSTFLMRGQICFGEVKQQETKWHAWGYGLNNHLGLFPSWDEAARAVVKSASDTLKEAGLSISAAA